MFVAEKYSKDLTSGQTLICSTAFIFKRQLVPQKDSLCLLDVPNLFLVKTLIYGSCCISWHCSAAELLAGIERLVLEQNLERCKCGGKQCSGIRTACCPLKCNREIFCERLELRRLFRVLPDSVVLRGRTLWFGNVLFLCRQAMGKSLGEGCAEGQWVAMCSSPGEMNGACLWTPL